MGWTRQQAIDYLNANTANRAVRQRDRGRPLHRRSRRQALAYKVGQLRIQALRDARPGGAGRAFRRAPVPRSAARQWPAAAAGAGAAGRALDRGIAAGGVPAAAAARRRRKLKRDARQNRRRQTRCRFSVNLCTNLQICSTRKDSHVSNQLTRRLALLDDDEHRALLGQGLRGIERETLRVDPHGNARAHAASGGAGLGADPSADHHRLRRSAARIHHPGRERHRHHAAPARRDPPLRLPAHGRRNAVERIDAVRAAAGRRHRDRVVRQVEHRHAQARVPARPGAALREGDAVHRRHPLQLLAA